MKIFDFLQRHTRTFLSVFFVVLGLGAASLGVFYVTAADTPFVSELAFIEHSANAEIIGSVIPASCESNPPTNHYAGDCQVPSPPYHPSFQCHTAGNYVNFWYPWPARASYFMVRLDYNGDPAPHIIENNYFVADGFGAYITPGVTYYAWVHACNVSGCSAPLGRVFSCPAPAVAAIGNFEAVEATTCKVRGWAYDPDIRSASIAVHVYRDASAFSGGTYVTSCTANTSRPDVNAAYGITGNHGFDCTLPASYRGTGAHNLYIHAIDTNSTPNNVISSSPKSLTCQPLPAVTLSASPNPVGPNSPTTLTWTVTGATSCTASGGTWTGSKSTSGGSEAVTPSGATTYTITCTNGTENASANVTVRNPSGTINATSCSIPVGGTGCTSAVSWTNSNFLGAARVSLASGAIAGTNPANMTVTPDNRTFTLDDLGSSFEATAVASVNCAASSTWVSSLNSCVVIPDIELDITPDIIRSGSTASVGISINSAYDLSCVLTGGINETINHTGNPATQNYTVTTGALTHAQIVNISCTAAAVPGLAIDAEARVSVIPVLEEI